MNSHFNTAGEELEDAFQVFNQFSERLADSYGVLEGQVVHLTAELAEARSERLAELAEKEMLAKNLSGLLDALPGGVIVLDAEGCITQANPVACDMLALHDCKEDYCGKKWQDIAPAMFVPGNELRLEDGRWVNISTCPLKDDPGKIILISDVSETHRLQQMLSQQQRLSSLGEMIASLAHQIRTPLSTALLYISSINHPNSDEFKKQYFSRKAKERLHHLERIVDDMLVFARGDVTDAEYVNVKKLCKQIESTIEHDYQDEPISLTMDESLDNMSIRANSDVLISALQNVIDNALDACRCSSKPVADIYTQVYLNDENQIEIKVSDNGCGLSEEIKDRILEPFFTTRSEGTGLGLAVVNATVERYQGKLDITSVAEFGCSISMSFPPVEVEGMLSSDLVNGDSGKLRGTSQN